MEQSRQQQGVNTPYDDAFKSILRKCPRLALSLINEMFARPGLIQEVYSGHELVTLLDKELPGMEMDLRLMVQGSIPR